MTEDASATLEIDRLRRRHRDFYLELAEQARAHILWIWDRRWVDGADERVWLDVLSDEHDNLRAALRWSIDAGHAASAMRFCVSLGGFWALRRHLEEGRRLIAETLEIQGDVPESLRADALTVAGVLAMEDGDYEAARASVGRALEWARAEGDLERATHCLICLAWIENYDGWAVRLRERAEEAVAQARHLGDPVLLSRALDAVLWAIRKEGPAQLERYETELRRLSSDVPARVWFDQLDTIANCWAISGDLQRYERIHREESLPLARNLGDSQFVAYALGNLAYAMSRSGDTAGAARHFEEALRAARAARLAPTAAEFLRHLAMIAIEEGRYGTAEILAEEALKTLDGLPGSTADDREARVRLRSVVEDAVVGRGDLHRARALVDRRLEEVRAHGPGARGKMLDLVVAGWDVVRVLDKRIGLAELTGDLDTALTDARTILEMGAQRVSEIEELGEEQDFIPTYLAGERARLALLEGRYADAVIEQRAAMDRIRERNEALMEAQYVAELARMQLVAGDAESAASTASDAVALADERSMPSVAASARFLLAEAERRRGRPEVARTVLRDALADPAVWKAPHAVRRLETVAGLASDEGSADVAVRLLAAADAARERMGMTVLVHQAPDRDDLLARMRAAEGFDEAWAEGSALSLGAARQEAAAYVRG